MKKVTTITLYAPKSGQTQFFDDYETFAMCIGFWYNGGDDSAYYAHDDSHGATFRKMYEASRDLICKVERTLGGLIVTFETEFR